MSHKVYKNRDWRYYTSYIKRFGVQTKDILDMGCGFGHFLEACRQVGLEGVGCDSSPERVKACCEKGLVAYQHDLSQPLHFAGSREFDAVFCNQVIEHVDDDTQENIVAEAFRVLKPKGEFLVCSPCRHFEQARQDPGHINLLTPSELKEMLVGAGFRSVNMGYNYPQAIPQVPADVVAELWRKYRPDLLSQTATALARK